MGTPEFAIPSLNILVNNGYDIVAVVTVPDKPSGRGQHVTSSPIKLFAQHHGLRILQPDSLKDPSFITQLHSLSADLFVVVAFRILPKEVFIIPKLGAFNLHASLLPKYRGAAPINWAIIKGERETGVTTFFLREAVDTGNIILQARIPIGDDDTAGDLHDAMAAVGAEVVFHTVRAIEIGKASQVMQDNLLASPAPKIFKEDCRINWHKPSQEVHNFIRGVSPRPGAFTMYDNTVIKIYRSKVVEYAQTREAGEIVSTDQHLMVQTTDGAIEVLELQQEGKKKLVAEEFLRGSKIHVGEKLI